MFSFEFYKVFKSIYFIQNLWATASMFCILFLQFWLKKAFWTILH